MNEQISEQAKECLVQMGESHRPQYLITIQQQMDLYHEAKSKQLREDYAAYVDNNEAKSKEIEELELRIKALEQENKELLEKLEDTRNDVVIGCAKNKELREALER